MPQLHSLLKRQLKNLPVERQEDPVIAKFIETVNQSYFDSDADRNMLERSLDISSHELSQLTASLASSNRELEQFAYIASHDLQEPLRMVASYLNLISQRYKDRLDEDANEFIGYAVDGALRMRALIEDLLVYSRVKTKAKSKEPVDLKSTLDAVLQNLKMSIVEKNSEVICTDLPVVLADPIAMLQLFQNLIGNALKFQGKEKPVVHVACEARGSDWLFSVRDNGIGIDPSNFDRLFQVFQRLHTKQEYPGTGIGLAICKKIVEHHGGRIWPESEPGKGTVFFFTIPKMEI